MESKFSTLIFVLLLTITSCKVEPKEINYGNVHCLYCDMTVVDKNHAAQYVTKKGKTYTFDAIECLTQKIIKENNEDQMAFILVADYANHGSLIDVKTATFLISEKIKSPMGANLSAFNSKEIAEKIQTEKGGELYTWKTLKIKLAK